MIAKLMRFVSIVTDWLLIAAGILLVLKAAIAVDVQVAKYGIMAVGVFIAGCGFWYRHRRKRRCR